MIGNKGEEEYFLFAEELWKDYENSLIEEDKEETIRKEQFTEWLIENDLDETIVEDLNSISLKAVSEGFLKSIYKCYSLDEIELFIESIDSRADLNLVDYYYYFTLGLKELEYDIDLSIDYALVKCHNDKEATIFLKNGYWEKQSKKVYSNYVEKLTKNSKIALIKHSAEKSKLLKVGSVKHPSHNGINLQVSWDNKNVECNLETYLTQPYLDFYLIEKIKEENLQLIKDIFYKDKMNLSQPHNQILYGPPGTGKTYKTKELAVNIILGKQQRERQQVLDLYQDLKEKNQINFSTFHQSMSYEDFVEGIKPVMNNDDETNQKDLSYEIKDGIFKEISKLANAKPKGIKQKSDIDFSKVDFYKMSIGGKHRKHIHDWCIDNNKVSLGYGDYEDYTDFISIDNWHQFRDKFIKEFPYLVESSRYHIEAMFRFQKMKKGDIVIVSLGNHIIDAIGVIEGDYEFNPESETQFYHERKVKWLDTNMGVSPELFLNKNISQQTIYQFNNNDIKTDKLQNYFKVEETNDEPKNYVLIIDEINRGNVSSIFGELITLLESDKRKGAKEAIELVLPYSKEPFSIPQNLYIIGTMNTADRSIEALDSALRRRFSFIEMPPNIEILRTVHANRGIIECNDNTSVDLGAILESINNRIHLLLDKDHLIGHSFFLKTQSFNDLKSTFKDKIIPLLEEYFYGDFAKIGLVLGTEFITRHHTRTDVFASFEYEDVESFLERPLFQITPSEQWTTESFISIYQ